MTGQKPKEKVLKWIDTTEPQKNENKSDMTAGTTAGGATASTPKKPMLARLIPLKETIAFDKRVSSHHSKTQRDVTSCLRGTRLNKF